MTNERSQTDELALRYSVMINLIRGENVEGTPVFAYVAVRGDEMDAFMRAQSLPNGFDPLEFGVIIESGEGEPSEEIRARMLEEYGFNHDQMLELPKLPTPAKIDPKG
ncbi:MAG: hypothetical protein EAY65_07670 [Alphaproteobacteria bacterium]|nr:MAG: hypothetical protein EAY65_07670 [Alphaproteobacteria bacterium]